MAWTLDQNLFRYVVGLYAVSLVLDFAFSAYETFVPGWDEFSTQFDALVDQHFGVQSDPVAFGSLAVALVILAWHLAALVGLRAFRRWARWSFWGSMALVTAVTYAAEGSRPSFAGPLSSTAADISAGLFAVIVLLSYSREHGVVWFRTPLETLRETF